MGSGGGVDGKAGSSRSAETLEHYGAPRELAAAEDLVWVFRQMKPGLRRIFHESKTVFASGIQHEIR